MNIFLTVTLSLYASGACFVDHPPAPTHGAPITETAPTAKPSVFSIFNVERETNEKEQRPRVEGHLPRWLRGSLVHVAPSKFRYGDDSVDWTGGAAMIFKLTFRGNGDCSAVSFRSRFLNSFEHRANSAANRLVEPMGASRPRIASPLLRAKSFLRQPENANAHVSLMAGRLIASNPVSKEMEIDSTTLETVGAVKYEDDLSGLTELTCEAILDPKTSEWINTAAVFKPSPEYVVYGVSPDGKSSVPGSSVRRRLLARIPRPEGVGWVHTFGLTENYACVIHCPYLVDLGGIAKSVMSYILKGGKKLWLSNFYTWHPEKPLVVYLADRNTGKVREFELPPFYYTHVVNAYEVLDDDRITVVIDVCGQDRPPRAFDHDVRDLKGDLRLVDGRVRRIRIDVETGSRSVRVFDRPRTDCLAINPSYIGRKHRYSYGEHVVEAREDGAQSLRLAKVDHDRRSVEFWKGQDFAATKCMSPKFVPRPGAIEEDDGVVITYLQGNEKGDTYVVVLNAKTLEEMARISLSSSQVSHLVHSTWVPPESISSE